MWCQLMDDMIPFSQTHNRIKKPCLSTQEKQAFQIPIIPTRQVETHSKLFCIDRLIPFGLI